MHTTQLAIDLAKSVVQVAVSRTPGRVEEQHRLPRSGLTRFFAEREPSTVFLEACGSGHYWGRTLQELGHEVRLLPPSGVARYRDGNKTESGRHQGAARRTSGPSSIDLPPESYDSHLRPGGAHNPRAAPHAS